MALKASISATAISHDNGLSRSLDKVFEEAQLTGVLLLNNRKLKSYPDASLHYDLTDTIKTDLSGNRFSELPVHICDFVSLESLNLHGNRIRSIPLTVQNLESLTFLDLSRNQLQRVPPELCLLPLEVLILSNNFISCLPKEIARLSDSLMELEVSCNRLESLPKEMGHLKQLRVLNCRDNLLRELPVEICSLMLCVLDVSFNRITHLDLEMRHMFSLIVLKMDNNPLAFPSAGTKVTKKGCKYVFDALETEQIRRGGSGNVRERSGPDRYKRSSSTNRLTAKPRLLPTNPDDYRFMMDPRIEKRKLRHNAATADSGYSTLSEEMIRFPDQVSCDNDESVRGHSVSIRPPSVHCSTLTSLPPSTFSMSRSVYTPPSTDDVNTTSDVTASLYDECVSSYRNMSSKRNAAAGSSTIRPTVPFNNNSRASAIYPATCNVNSSFASKSNECSGGFQTLAPCSEVLAESHSSFVDEVILACERRVAEQRSCDLGDDSKTSANLSGSRASVVGQSPHSYATGTQQENTPQSLEKRTVLSFVSPCKSTLVKEIGSEEKTRPSSSITTEIDLLNGNQQNKFCVATTLSVRDQSMASAGTTAATSSKNSSLKTVKSDVIRSIYTTPANSSANSNSNRANGNKSLSEKNSVLTFEAKMNNSIDSKTNMENTVTVAADAMNTEMNGLRAADVPSVDNEEDELPSAATVSSKKNIRSSPSSSTSSISSAYGRTNKNANHNGSTMTRKIGPKVPFLPNGQSSYASKTVGLQGKSNAAPSAHSIHKPAANNMSNISSAFVRQSTICNGQQRLVTDPTLKGHEAKILSTRKSLPTGHTLQAANLDRQQKLAEELRRHISDILKVDLPEDAAELAEVLSDGIYLCKFLNQLRPKTVRAIHLPSEAVPRITMAKRNVENFLIGCRRFGITEANLCSISDVVERKNMAVHRTVCALKKALAPSYQHLHGAVPSGGSRIGVAPTSSAPANGRLVTINRQQQLTTNV